MKRLAHHILNAAANTIELTTDCLAGLPLTPEVRKLHASLSAVYSVFHGFVAGRGPPLSEKQRTRLFQQIDELHTRAIAAREAHERHCSRRSDSPP